MQTNKLLVFLSAAMLICFGRLQAGEVSTAPSRADIENIVREYILQHPEVLMESVQSQRERERVQAQKRSDDGIAANRRELFDDAASPVIGSANAEIAIVQFFDYKCGYCRRVAPTISKLLEEHKNVRVIFKELPILGPESHIAARAALAAAKQGAYAPFHQRLLSTDGPITPQAVEEVADQLGLDVARLRADMSSPEVTAILVQNQQLANTLGVQSTPSFVIGNELVPGAMDLRRFEELISKSSSR
jgi:protein-disulfide isomerase